MTALLTVLCALLLAAVPAAYYFGRRSVSESYVDRVLNAETDRRRLNPQKAEDQAGAGDG